MNRFTPLVVALLILSSALCAQTWVKDASITFDLRREVVHDTTAHYLPTPDGGLLAYGTFTHAGTPAREARGIARLNQDLTLDPVFRSPFQTGVGSGSFHPLADGRFLLAWATPDGTAMMRFGADGSPDSTFDPLPFTGSISFAAGRDQVIYAWSWAGIGPDRKSLVRLRPDGTLDPSFNSTGLSSVIQCAPLPDGRVLVLTPSRLVRLEADGSASTLAGGAAASWPVGYPAMIGVQPDGAFLLAEQRQLRRFTADGAHDPTFELSFPDLTTIDAIRCRADGRIVLAITAGTGPHASPSTVLVLSSTGAVVQNLRNHFSPSTTVELKAVLSDGRLLITHGRAVIINEPVPGVIYNSDRPASATGRENEARPVAAGFVAPLPPEIIPHDPQLAVVSADGLQVTPISLGLREPDAPVYAHVTTDRVGQLLVLGDFTHVGESRRPGLARFTASGLDHGFNPPLTENASRVAYTDPDQGFIVAHMGLVPTGHDDVARYGTAYSWVNDNGTVEPLQIAPVRRDFRWRWHAKKDGHYLVSSFPQGDHDPANLRIGWYDRAGQLVRMLPTTFAGQFFSWPFAENEGGVRASAVPEPDPTLSQPEPHYENPLTGALPLDNGKILVTGSFNRVNGVSRVGLVRLNADGSVDASFVPEGGGAYALTSDGVFQSITEWRHGQLRYVSYHVGEDGRRTDLVAPTPTRLQPEWLDRSGNPKRYDRFVTLADQAWGLIYDSPSQYRPVMADHFIAENRRTVTIEPANPSLVAGRDLRLNAVLGTAEPATFQWYQSSPRNPPLGSTHRAVLEVPEINLAQAGSYWVVVTFDDGQSITAEAQVVVHPSTAHLINGSALVQVDGGPAPVLGFALGESVPRARLLRGMGPTLKRFRVEPPLLDPHLALFRDSSLIAEQAGRLGQDEAEALAASVGAFPHDEGFPALHDLRWRDAAFVGTLGSGAYTLHATSVTGRTGRALLEIYDSAPGLTSGTLRNLSLRARLTNETRSATLGFVVTGSGPAPLLLRAVAPTLRKHGVAATLPDPRLSVYPAYPSAFGPVSIGRPEDEKARGAATRLGAFPLQASAGDLAWVEYLEPGAYTAQLTSASQAEGEAMIELYLLD